MEKLGIDKIEDAFLASINLTEKVDSALEDDHISIGEWSGIVFKIFPVIKAFKEGKLLWAQIEDIDADEADQLTKLVEDDLQCSNEKAKRIVDAVVKWLTSTANLIRTIRE
jgi:hypothetical protein